MCYIALEGCEAVSIGREGNASSSYKYFMQNVVKVKDLQIWWEPKWNFIQEGFY
jgi:hypothetical protein